MLNICIMKKEKVKGTHTLVIIHGTWLYHNRNSINNDMLNR